MEVLHTDSYRYGFLQKATGARTTSSPAFIGERHLPQQIKHFMQSFAAFAECICLPFISFSPKCEALKDSVSMDALPDYSTHWYCVRQQPGNEFFTVRRVPRLPDEEALVLRSESTWMDMHPTSELMKRNPLQRSQSVPRSIERRWCLRNNTSQEEFREDLQCKICYSEAADVVLLPCRHGGMCYRCFRRSLFMRPIHRGGCTCPTCRRQISEVVRIGMDQLRKPSSRSRYGIGASPLECF